MVFTNHGQSVFGLSFLTMMVKGPVNTNTVQNKRVFTPNLVAAELSPLLIIYRSIA